MPEEGFAGGFARKPLLRFLPAPGFAKFRETGGGAGGQFT